MCVVVSRTLALGPLLLLLLASSCCRCLYGCQRSISSISCVEQRWDIPFCRLCVVAEERPCQFSDVKLSPAGAERVALAR